MYTLAVSVAGECFVRSAHETTDADKNHHCIRTGLQESQNDEAPVCHHHHQQQCHDDDDDDAKGDSSSIDGWPSNNTSHQKQQISVINGK